MSAEQRPAWPDTRPSLFWHLAHDGTGEAWSTFVGTYGPLVYRYCRRRGLQHADAEDVTQGVTLKVRHFEYQPEKGRFRDWLRTVTLNEIRRSWAKSNRPGRGTGGEPPVPLDQREGAGADVDWDRLFDAHILETALERVRRAVSDLEWQAFEAVAFKVADGPDGKRVAWVQDPAPEEVAQSLGKKVAWVYKAKWKVMKRLKEEVVYLAEELGVLV